MVEENLRHSFRVLASSRGSGEVREMPGVTIASAGVAFQMFNAAFLSTPVTGDRELDQRIAIAKIHFGARRLDWSYWVCENWLDKKARRAASEVFRRHGLFQATELPGMLAERVLRPVRELPKLQIRTVSDDQTWSAFCQIGAVCFNVPLEWFQEIFRESSVWQKGFSGYVGYLAGEPVSTAATVVDNDAVGVYNVATLPGHQRRGCGETVMRHALERAQQESGIERSVLQSTSQGFRLYQQMGYAAVTKVVVYTS
ncbi:MAG: hypothetical protein DMG57_25390 [Acidobacteria bacterium]|nr:MAG: hypothetical protein DMG57_25390 [Acidobacteriota bacterium]